MRTKVKGVIVFVKNFIKRFNESDVIGLSAQLAYFFLLSLFPLLMVLVTLLGYIPIGYQDVVNFLATYIPDDLVYILEENVAEVINGRNGGLLSIGIIGTLWAASNAINRIVRAFNTAYNVEENRPFLVSRLISIILLVAMLFTIIIAFLLPIFGHRIGVFIFSFFNGTEEFLQLWNMLRWLISSSIFFIVFLVLYRLAPNVKVYFKDIVFGALFATLGWQISSLGFSFYVNEFGNYSATYGSLGGVVVLMVWFFMTGIIILTGGEFNAMLHERRVNKKR